MLLFFLYYVFSLHFPGAIISYNGLWRMKVEYIVKEKQHRLFSSQKMFKFLLIHFIDFMITSTDKLMSDKKSRFKFQ